jgi:hypothetical protein
MMRGMEERRKQYRVPFEGERGSRDADEEVRAYVGGTADGVGRIEAEVQDLSAGGVRLATISEARAPGAVGSKVHFWLVDRPNRVEVGFEAVVLQRLEQPAKRVFGLEFTDPRVVETLHRHPTLARLFNRRAALRVRPDPRDGEVQCTVVARRGPVPPAGGVDAGGAIEPGVLVDLSVNGLGVDVGEAFERRMVGHDRVDCTFRLPGTDTRLTIAGRVVRRLLRDSGGRVLYGVVFSEPQEPADHRAREQLLTWVTQRQKAIYAALSASPGAAR